MRKQTIWVATRSDTNVAVQTQKMVRGLKFCIEVGEKLEYPCSEIKGADQLKLICAFAFAHADCWFSHAVAHNFIIYEMTPHNRI